MPRSISCWCAKSGSPGSPNWRSARVVDGADPQVLINEGLASERAVERSYITTETARQLSEIERCRRVYLGDKPPPALGGRTIIIVDDGIATGSTARAALRAVRKAGSRRIVLAVPLAPEDTIEQLRAELDDMVCLSSPSPFIAVGAHYGEFPQLADADVIALLAERDQAMTRSPGRAPKDQSSDQEKPTVGILPLSGLVPIIGPVYGASTGSVLAGFFGSCCGFSWLTICLEISGTELKLMVAGRLKQLRDLSWAHGSAFAAAVAQATDRANIRIVETPALI